MSIHGSVTLAASACNSGGAPVTGDKPALDIYLDRLNVPAGARTDGAAFTLDCGIGRN